jgi:hypothetical protein
MPDSRVKHQPQESSENIFPGKGGIQIIKRPKMAKPLISSTFFSSPKLLLWSLPLLFILIYTYLFAGLDTQLKTLVSLVLPAEKAVNYRAPMLHEASFSPDFILLVSEQPFTQSCITKSDVILINGTSPGPEIRLKEGICTGLGSSMT